MTLTLTQHPLAVHGQCMDPTGTLVCRMHETHVLGDDAVEVLGPRRPAFDIPRVLVTVLVAQHRGLAGRVGAGGVAGGPHTSSPHGVLGWLGGSWRRRVAGGGARGVGHLDDHRHFGI